MLASTEIAMMGLKEGQLRKKAESGDKKASLLLVMKQNPSDFLSTVQVGITLAGLLSGAFAADSLATPIVQIFAGMGISGGALSAIHFLSVMLITLLTTYFMLVFGELVPKRLAMARPEETARSVVSFLTVLSKITRPLVLLLSASTNLVLRLIGIDPNRQENPVTEEEILLMIHEGRQQGTIEESEVELVTNVFEFTDQRAKNIMKHRTEIDALPVSAKMLDVIALMSKTKHNKFPIYNESIDDIVGVLYTSDIVALYPYREKLPKEVRIEDIMRKPVFVPESNSLTKLFQKMKQTGERLFIVADEYGGTAGMITLTDILEEIVGDIDIDSVPDGHTGEHFAGKA